MAAATLGACVQIVPCGAPSTLTRRTLALGSAATTPPLPPPLLSHINQIKSLPSDVALPNTSSVFTSSHERRYYVGR